MPPKCDGVLDQSAVAVLGGGFVWDGWLDYTQVTCETPQSRLHARTRAHVHEHYINIPFRYPSSHSLLLRLFPPCSFANRTMPEAGRIRAVLADALDVWARNSMLTFRETYDDEADIRVMFVG